MITGGQLHLGIVDIGTVVEQLKGYACTECGGERLTFEIATLYLLSRLSKQETEGILRLLDLTFQVGCLRLDHIMTGLSALHTGRTGTSQFFLQLHNTPSLFSQSYHLIHNL